MKWDHAVKQKSQPPEEVKIRAHFFNLNQLDLHQYAYSNICDLTLMLFKYFWPQTFNFSNSHVQHKRTWLKARSLLQLLFLCSYLCLAGNPHWIAATYTTIYAFHIWRSQQPPNNKTTFVSLGIKAFSVSHSLYTHS